MDERVKRVPVTARASERSAIAKGPDVKKNDHFEFAVVIDEPSEELFNSTRRRFELNHCTTQWKSCPEAGG